MPDKIIYIGNALSGSGSTPTTIESLGNKLAADFSVKIFSRKRNLVLRMLDVVIGIYKNRSARVVLIDTYSTLNFLMSYVASRIAKQLKIPYIPILHGGNLPDRLERREVMLMKYLDEAAEIVAPSGFLKFHFDQKHYKVHLIPNFLEIKNYKFTKREKTGCRLLYVRSFHSIYNPQMAIRVLAELKKNYSEARLCMVGPDKDGSMQICKELANELGVADSIEFTGVLSKQDWIKKSEEFDIFINTTNVDNTPVSVIEAMALGLPVVSTNVGGIPYLLTDEVDALLVEKGDVGEMVRAIHRLVEDKSLVNQLTNAARKKVENFDWKVVRNQWLGLINYVAGEDL